MNLSLMNCHIKKQRLENELLLQKAHCHYDDAKDNIEMIERGCFQLDELCEKSNWYSKLS